jgi:hypothetical protein
MMNVRKLEMNIRDNVGDEENGRVLRDSELDAVSGGASMVEYPLLLNTLVLASLALKTFQ